MCDDLLVTVAKAALFMCCSRAFSVGGRPKSNPDPPTRNFCVFKLAKESSPLLDAQITRDLQALTKSSFTVRESKFPAEMLSGFEFTSCNDFLSIFFSIP